MSGVRWTGRGIMLQVGSLDGSSGGDGELPDGAAVAETQRPRCRATAARQRWRRCSISPGGAGYKPADAGRRWRMLG